MGNLTTRDVIYTGLALTAFAMGSIAEMNVQRLEGQIAGLEQTVADQRIELTAQDMGNLKLDNEVREQIGMEVINFGIAGYSCERR